MYFCIENGVYNKVLQIKWCPIFLMLFRANTITFTSSVEICMIFPGYDCTSNPNILNLINIIQSIIVS